MSAEEIPLIPYEVVYSLCVTQVCDRFMSDLHTLHNLSGFGFRTVGTINNNLSKTESALYYVCCLEHCCKKCNFMLHCRKIHACTGIEQFPFRTKYKWN